MHAHPWVCGGLWRDCCGRSRLATARAGWIEQQLLPRYASSQAQRDEIGLARAQAVQSAVLANSELKPERVFLTERVSGGGPEGSVRMELKLE